MGGIGFKSMRHIGR